MIGCTEQVFFIIVITFKRCMLLELVSTLTFRPKTSYLCFMSKFISEEIHTPPPLPTPSPQKKKELNKIFIPLFFLKWDFKLYTFCLFFPNFQLSKHLHASLLSEPYACHSYTCQCLILCKFFFSLQIYCTIFSILYRSVCMLTKLNTNLNSICSSLAYFCEIYGKVSLIKKKFCWTRDVYTSLVELGKISMFVQILWNQCCLLQRY